MASSTDLERVFYGSYLGFTEAVLATKTTAELRAAFVANGPAARNVPPLNALAPAGAIAETFPRPAYSNVNNAPGNGALFLCAIPLVVGVPVGSITFVSSTVAAVTPTHWWYGLYDSNRVQLAVTADQLTAAWPASTAKTLPIAATAAGAATTFTPTYTGLYYVGIMQTAATLVNLPASAYNQAVGALPPFISGPSTTGLVAGPPAFPFTGAAITANTSVPYAFVAST